MKKFMFLPILFCMMLLLPFAVFAAPTVSPAYVQVSASLQTGADDQGRPYAIPAAEFARMDLSTLPDDVVIVSGWQPFLDNAATAKFLILVADEALPAAITGALGAYVTEMTSIRPPTRSLNMSRRSPSKRRTKRL